MAAFSQSDDLQGAHFVDVNLRGARFVRCDLSGAVMRAVDAAGADIDALRVEVERIFAALGELNLEKMSSK